MTSDSYFLVYLFVYGLSLIVFYYIIKAAVKSGISNDLNEIKTLIKLIAEKQGVGSEQLRSQSEKLKEYMSYQEELYKRVAAREITSEKAIQLKEIKIKELNIIL